MSLPLSQIELIHELEQHIFKEFALETSDNIHVKSVDLKNPLTSVCKILLCDIVTSQLNGESDKLTKIVPQSLFICDNDSEDCAYIRFSRLGVSVISNLLHSVTTANQRQLIDDFRKSILHDGTTTFLDAHCDEWSKHDEQLTEENDHQPSGEQVTIPFENEQTEAGRQDDYINYTFKIGYLEQGEQPLAPETIKAFLTKVATLGLHTKRNRRNFSEIEKQATKAAISQVMARNMSHNIGSHVLSKFKDASEIKGVYQGLPYSQQYVGIADLYGDEKDMAGPRLIGYFNEYLKNRMDFLADIATTDPVMETPMYLIRDIIRGFDKNRVLLNRISGISSETKFELKVFCRDGIESIEFNPMHNEDPLLSIPNEILGAQAFYILLENVIRNIYKHGNPDPRETIQLVIHVNDLAADPSFYEIIVYDNSQKEEQLIDSVVQDRNVAFDESVLYKNALRSDNLGTIEMDVCAAYLRCLPVTSIEDDRYSLKKQQDSDVPRLIFAYKQPLTGDTFSLGYKLYISKPKEVLVITRKRSDFAIACATRFDYLNHGICIIEGADLQTRSVYNHQLIYSLLPPEEFEAAVKDRARLPKRIVFQTDLADTTAIPAFLTSIWQAYATAHFFKKQTTYKLYNGSTDVANAVCVRTSGGKLELISDCREDGASVYIDDHNARWKDQQSWAYYDMACSHSRISKVKGRIFFDNDIRSTAEYLEVINCRILLIDERLQQNVIIENKPYEGTGGKTPFAEYYGKQHILIPDKATADLNCISFGKLDAVTALNHPQSESDRIYRYVKQHIERADFIVIHLGVLEKMLSSDRNKKRDGIAAVISQLIGPHRHKLIVTSGRGKPNNLPKDIAFVSLALIQNAVETHFDKFLLTKILYNARISV
jgi:hypothetical protein